MFKWLRDATPLYKSALLVAQTLHTQGYELASLSQVFALSDDSTRADAFVAALEASKMDSMITMKPLLDGHKIGKLLNAQGKIIGTVVAALIEWQITNFEIMNVQQAEQFVLQKFKQ